MGLTASSMIPLSVSKSGSSHETYRFPKVPEYFDESVYEKVQLYVYDMTHGLSPAFSALFSKFDFEALWHTSIVLSEREYSYGQLGMRVDEPPGKPHKIIDVGWTHISKRTLYEYLIGLRNNIFYEESYDIFHKNCNSFSEYLCQFLTGDSIPYEYRTFGQRMKDQCEHYYNIHSQEQLFEYVRTLQL